MSGQGGLEGGREARWEGGRGAREVGRDRGRKLIREPLGPHERAPCRVESYFGTILVLRWVFVP